jgi:RecA/RadA recombinase
MTVQVRLIGISGPDGSGKTTLAAAVRAEALRRGVPATSVHVYGCFICRRWPPRSIALERGPERSPSHGHPVGTVRRLHVLLDTAELAARVWLAGQVLRLRARRAGRPAALLVTDRSPLDGLAKHSAAAEGWAGSWYLALARSYEMILVLFADVGLMATRDGTHDAVELALWQARFEAWRPLLARVRAIDSSGAFDPALVDEMLAVVRHGS